MVNVSEFVDDAESRLVDDVGLSICQETQFRVERYCTRGNTEYLSARQVEGSLPEHATRIFCSILVTGMCFINVFYSSLQSYFMSCFIMNLRSVLCLLHAVKHDHKTLETVLKHIKHKNDVLYEYKI